MGVRGMRFSGGAPVGCIMRQWSCAILQMNVARNSSAMAKPEVRIFWCRWLVRGFAGLLVLDVLERCVLVQDMWVVA